jgi:hypothetical protein
MKITTIIFFITQVFLSINVIAQTIPNNDLETWINHGQYDDPQAWDTPNQEVCFFPFYTKVVTKSTDHYSGSFSAKLETKEIPIVNITVPGVITLGTLVIDIGNMTYSIEGGVPMGDKPTHLKGYFKYSPKGGDSCAIGILLSKWADSTRDTVGYGYFSSPDTVTSWTYFSAWIDYPSSAMPDTMNILAISSATFSPTGGTILYLDGLYLDYTTGIKGEDPSTGIDFYQDSEQRELMVFFNFPEPRSTSVRLYNLMGQVVKEAPPYVRMKDKVTFSYGGLGSGIYIMQVIHEDQKVSRKFIVR